jgi:sugar phosphate isomerase/epimerase
VELACSLNIFSSLRLEESCRRARRAGFRSVEVDWDQVVRQMPAEDRRSDRIRDILLKNELTIASADVGRLTAERPDQLRLQVRSFTSALTAIRAVGVRLAVLTGGPRSLENFNCLREGLRETLAGEAGRIGLELAVANRVETRVEDRQDLLALFTAGFPANVGVCVDVYHCHLAAVNAGDVIREMGPRIKLFRMSDLMGPVAVPFGQGEIEIKGLIRSLRRVGYDGFLVVDHLPGREERADRELERAYGYLQGIIS